MSCLFGFSAVCSILFICTLLLTVTSAPCSDTFPEDPDIVAENPALDHENGPSEKSEKFSFNDPTGPSISQVAVELTVEIDDFLVNDDTLGGCGQSFPAIGTNQSGNSVIVCVGD